MGMFKTIQVSIALLIASPLFKMLLILLQGYLTSTTVTALVLLIGRQCCLKESCDVYCVLPFTVGDQLIEASGEQLSLAMCCMMWGFVFAFHTILLSYIPFDYSDIIAPAVALSCVSTMVNTIHYQPLRKLICRLFHSSWKHKYPERSSTLTYWEEDIPSCTDQGKSRYGGPFTVKEVEPS